MKYEERDEWIEWLKFAAERLRTTYRMGRIPAGLEQLAMRLELERNLELFHDGYGREVVRALLDTPEQQ